MIIEFDCCDDDDGGGGGGGGGNGGREIDVVGELIISIEQEQKGFLFSFFFLDHLSGNSFQIDEIHKQTLIIMFICIKKFHKFQM